MIAVESLELHLGIPCDRTRVTTGKPLKADLYLTCRDLYIEPAASHHLLLGHGLGVQAFRASGAKAQIGVTMIGTHFAPASNFPAHRAAAQRHDDYYYRSIVADDADGGLLRSRTVEVTSPVTNMGWEIYPQGLEALLIRVHQVYGGIPIYITENGMGGIELAKVLDQVLAAG